MSTPFDPLDDLQRARRSTRAYRNQAVSPECLAEILRVSRCAPSSCNLQPGDWVAVQGAARDRLQAALHTAWQAGQQEPSDCAHLPSELSGVLRRRRLDAAQALYNAMGIDRTDSARRAEQFGRNFRFFDAPVALILTLDRRFGEGGFLDLGMQLYAVMLAAQARGLSTCALGSVAAFPHTVRQALGLPASARVVCGLALGYADPTVPGAQVQPGRADLSEFFKVCAD